MCFTKVFVTLLTLPWLNNAMNRHEIKMLSGNNTVFILYKTPPDRPHHKLWRVLEHIQQEIAHHTVTCTPGDTGICIITNTCSKIEALPPGTSQNEIEYNATCSWLRYDEGIHHDTSLHTINKPSSLKVWGLGLCSVAVISLSGLFGGLFWPLINSNFYNQMMRILIGLAVGSLSATSTFQLIPEGFQIKNDESYLSTAFFMWSSLWALYMFEVLSKILLHKRDNDQREQLPIHRLPNSEEQQTEEGLLSNYARDSTSVTKPARDTANCGHPTSKTTVAYMIIFGDALHNFIDGMSIGAGYSKDLSAGLAISIAVACEEFPHELGDFAILINAGMPVKKALMYNFLSACTSFGGVILGIVMGELETSVYIFAFAGGLFLYVSLADLMPELNRMVEEELLNSKTSAMVVLLLQNGGIFIGVSTLYLITKYPVTIS
jgi:zinc transporter ZupT